MTLNYPSSWEPRLLERETEQESLNALIRDARRGHGTTALVEGGAGMGKSRLLEYARARAIRSGMRVFSARASELERDFPYGVVRQLFERFALDREDAASAQLTDGAASAALPALGHDRPEAQAPGVRGGETPFSTLHGLYSLCLNISEAEPVLLMVDDAQWGDMSSLRFLLYLSLRIEALPILLVAATRPLRADGRNPLARVSADPATLHIAPRPLGTASTGELLSSALGSQADDAFASACHELTGGNPFLLTELVRSLAAEDVQPTADNAKAVRERVPEAITRAAVVRLGRLPTDARELAYAVAILGDGCERRHAAALARIDHASAGDAADALRKAEILAAESPLRFVHPLVGSAIQAQLPTGARSREHQRAATLLAEDGASLERVAIHLLATEPADDAQVVQTLYDASRRAHEHGAPDAAFAYLLRALREPARGDIRGDIFELLVTAGLRAGALPVLTTMRTDLLAELMSDPCRLMRCAQDLATCLIVSGQSADGRAVAERARDAAKEAGDLALALALDVDLAFFTQLPPGAARPRLRRYAGHVTEGSPEQRLLLAVDAFWSCVLGGPASEAAALAKRALEGDDVFAEQRQLTPMAQAVLVLAQADQLDAAADAAARLIAVARSRGSVSGLAAAWYLRGLISYRRGELGAAEADARQAVHTARLHDIGLAPPFWHMLLVDVLAERDDVVAANRELDSSGMSGDVPDGYWLAPVLLARGRLRLAQDRPREAAADLLELRARQASWDISANPICPAATHAARALATCGDHARALELAEEGLGHAKRWGVESRVAEALAALGVVTGGREGIELLRDAVQRAEATPTRLLYASALADLGTLLRQERQLVTAREPLSKALDVARRCGAVGLARRVAWELEAVGVKVERYTPIGVDALTPSERRVADLAARGLTNREIAATLYVTVKTVESHLRSVYDKLGIASRHELRDVLTVQERAPAVASLT